MKTSARTYWLSFRDPDKPEGQQFLGGCVLDITAEEAAAIRPELEQRFPRHGPGADWLAAASQKAWRLGCNPGGEVAFTEITEAPARALKAYERGRLYSRAEIDALDRDLTRVR